MRNMFTSEILRLVSNVGWRYTSETVDDAADRLIAEGFFTNEKGEIVSPSGESFGSAIARVWEEGPAPVAKAGASIASTSEDAERARYGGFLKADLPTLSHETRLAVMMGAGEPPKVDPYISARPAAPVSVAEVTQRTGISAEAFAAMKVERKLEVEDCVKRLRGESDPERRLEIENHVKCLRMEGE